MATPKPAMVTQKVRQAWPAITAWYSMKSRKISQGLGKMNSETSKAAQTTCHSTTTISSSTQGDQRSSSLLLSLFIANPWLLIG